MARRVKAAPPVVVSTDIQFARAAYDISLMLVVSSAVCRANRLYCAPSEDVRLSLELTPGAAKDSLVVVVASFTATAISGSYPPVVEELLAYIDGYICGAQDWARLEG